MQNLHRVPSQDEMAHQQLTSSKGLSGALKYGACALVMHCCLQPDSMLQTSGNVCVLAQKHVLSFMRCCVTV